MRHENTAKKVCEATSKTRYGLLPPAGLEHKVLLQLNYADLSCLQPGGKCTAKVSSFNWITFH